MEVVDIATKLLFMSRIMQPTMGETRNTSLQPPSCTPSEIVVMLKQFDYGLGGNSSAKFGDYSVFI